jgi:hypothetical protein
MLQISVHKKTERSDTLILGILGNLDIFPIGILPIYPECGLNIANHKLTKTQGGMK